MSFGNNMSKFNLETLLLRNVPVQLRCQMLRDVTRTHLKRDGGVGLYQEVAVPLTRLRMDSDLELLGVISVSLLKVGPREESRGLHLTLGHILNPRGQVVLVTLIVLVIIIYVNLEKYFEYKYLTLHFVPLSNTRSDKENFWTGIPWRLVLPILSKVNFLEM